MSRVKKGQIEVLKVAKIRPRLLCLKDTARYLGLSPQTLYNRGQNGFPVKPVIRGGKPYWFLDECDEYAKSLPREK